jgi:hypothetical protein
VALRPGRVANDTVEGIHVFRGEKSMSRVFAAEELAHGTKKFNVFVRGTGTAEFPLDLNDGLNMHREGLFFTFQWLLSQRGLHKGSRRFASRGGHKETPRKEIFIYRIKNY